jgi:hypothetical protein
VTDAQQTTSDHHVRRADRHLGLRAVTAVVRRLGPLAGPLAWPDGPPLLWGQQRRVLDHLTGTKVVPTGAAAV